MAAQEHRLIGWLVSKGVPATTAKTLLWIVSWLSSDSYSTAASWLTLLLAVCRCGRHGIQKCRWGR